MIKSRGKIKKPNSHNGSPAVALSAQYTDIGEDFFQFMQECIRELEFCGQKKTAASYLTAFNSLQRFTKSNKLEMNQLLPSTLKRYETWLREKGLTYNTTSCYMRVLRAVYNRAVKKDIAPRCNPFEEVFTGVEKTTKRAVDDLVLRKLIRLPLETTSPLALTRDLFLFSIYARGMPFVDMAYLKKNNVINGYIVYNRHKTAQKLVIKIESYAREILTKYTHLTHDNFLLPILHSGINYQSALRIYNQRLKILSAEIGLHPPLSSYVARHTWASIAYRKGIPLPVISQSMGHTDEKTTRIYLLELDQKVIDEANNQLLAELYSGL